jgi:hypothetical protein
MAVIHQNNKKPKNNFYVLISECDSPGVETTTRAAISHGCNAYAIFKGHEGKCLKVIYYISVKCYVKFIFKIYF